MIRFDQFAETLGKIEIINAVVDHGESLHIAQRHWLGHTRRHVQDQEFDLQLVADKSDTHAITLPSSFIIRKILPFVNLTIAAKSALPHHHIFLAQPLAAFRQQRGVAQTFARHQLSRIGKADLHR